MKYNEDDNLLVDMVSDANEEIRDSLYEKYEPTINYMVKRFSKTAYKLGLDHNDLIQEANLAFTDAINTYDQNKEANLKTFIIICINRRLTNVIEQAKTTKNKMNQHNLSLDYEYDKEGSSLRDVISDTFADPSFKYSEQENFQELQQAIKDNLSQFEITVFTYMLNGLNYQEIAEKLDKSPKQIDNTMQRVKAKVRNLLERR